MLIQGVARAGLEGFRGTLGNRRRVGRVGRVVSVVVDSARRDAGATDEREVTLRSIILR